MKTIIKHTVACALCMLFTLNSIAQNAQNAQAAEPYVLTVTKAHWSKDLKDFSRSEWIKLEKEYMDKVVSKNEHILATNVLTHYFTQDNTEILFVTLYKNWSGVQLAKARTQELEQAAWPNKEAREAHFEKVDSYYDSEHSDEIYSALPISKELTAMSDKPLVYYVRIQEKAHPKDGSYSDFTALNNQYFDSVIQKNENIKAYYSYEHLWGANSNDFVEVFVVDDLGAIDKMFDRDETLFKDAFKDEAKQKDYNKKIGKYFTGKHGDYVYQSVPELMKRANHSDVAKR